MKAHVFILGFFSMVFASSAFALTCYPTDIKVNEVGDKMEVRNSSDHRIYLYLSDTADSSCPSSEQYIKVKSGESEYATKGGYIIVCNHDMEYRCTVSFDDQLKLKICESGEHLTSDGKCQNKDPEEAF